MYRNNQLVGSFQKNRDDPAYATKNLGSWKRSNTRGSSSVSKSGIREIKATEIKAFLYAWCGQRRMKPEYECKQRGIQPLLVFAIRLTVHGIDHSEYVEAYNKKDAQSKAAWNFVDYLVECGQIKKSELPQRPTAPALGARPVLGSKLIKGTMDSKEEIFANGGWTLFTSRPRLNQFVQRDFSQLDKQHFTTGAEHARTFSCKYKLYVNSVQKEYFCEEQGTTKKQAESLAALSLVRTLFKEGIIERQGDMPFVEGAVVNQYAARQPVFVPEIKYNPKINNKLTMKPSAFQNNGPSTLSKVDKITKVNGVDSTDKLNHSMVNTPKMLVMDQYLQKKHKSIYPTNEELATLQEGVRRTECALKETVQELNDVEKRSGKDESVMIGSTRIGNLIKGLVLAGDLDVNMAVICEHPPTKSTLTQVARILPQKIVQGQNCKVKPNVENASIELVFDAREQEVHTSLSVAPMLHDVRINIWFTSLELCKQEGNPELMSSSSTHLDTKTCLQTLAELRRATWFQDAAAKTKWYVPVCLILHHLRINVKGWNSLSSWTLEVIAQKAMNSSLAPQLSLASALSCVLTFITSGTLTKDDSGFIDPCEKENTINCDSFALNYGKVAEAAKDYQSYLSRVK